MAGLQIEAAGRKVVFDMEEMTGVDERDFRKATGYTIAAAWNAAIEGELNLEAIAGFVWLVARKDEPQLAYDDVLAGVSYKDIGDGLLSEPEADAGPPTTEDGNTDK